MVNTAEELDVISAALRAAGRPRVIVVTNKAHTRRVYILLEMLLWDNQNNRTASDMWRQWWRKLRIRSGKTSTVGCPVILAILAATLSIAADAYPKGQSSSPATQSSLKHSKHKNLPNFGEATVTLYHGGQPSKNGFRTLAKMGVNTPRHAVRGATLGVFVSQRYNIRGISYVAAEESKQKGFRSLPSG